MAFVRPQVDWLPPLDNVLHNAKATIVVPANGLQINNLQNHLGQWQLTHIIEQPIENAGADYYLFELIGSVSDSVFEMGVEMPLFSFENTRSCAGAFEMMDLETDPFAMPNAMSCLLYTSPSPRDRTRSRMPSSA